MNTEAVYLEIFWLPLSCFHTGSLLLFNHYLVSVQKLWNLILSHCLGCFVNCMHEEFYFNLSNLNIKLKTSFQQRKTFLFRLQRRLS